MALERQKAVQRDTADRLAGGARRAGACIYDRPSAVLDETGLDRKVEELWAPHYAALGAFLGLWAASLMIRPRPAEWRTMRRHLTGFTAGLPVRAAR